MSKNLWLLLFLWYSTFLHFKNTLRREFDDRKFDSRSRRYSNDVSGLDVRVYVNVTWNQGIMTRDFFFYYRRFFFVKQESGLRYLQIFVSISKCLFSVAMATHMAERNLILESLRDLHASLGSRPAETKMAPQPSLLKTSLMLYQRHALAWLQWRETQKPAAGILGTY